MDTTAQRAHSGFYQSLRRGQIGKSLCQIQGAMLCRERRHLGEDGGPYVGQFTGRTPLQRLNRRGSA